MKTSKSSRRLAAPAVAFGGVALAALGIGGVKALFGHDADARLVGKQKDGTVRLVTDETLHPAGTVQTLPGPRPKDLAVSPDGLLVAVLAQSRVVIYPSAGGDPVGSVALADGGPLGIAWSPDGAHIYASEAKGNVAILARESGGWAKGKGIELSAVSSGGAPDVAAGDAGRGSQTGDPQVNGLAVSPDGRRLYVALGIRNAVAIVDLAEGKVEKAIAVGVAPYHVTLSPDGSTLAVACRGGVRPAKSGEPSAPSAATAVRIDTRTDAALDGGIALIDTATGSAVTVPAGRQPSGMAFTRDGKTLYAASSDDDTVLVLDVAGRRVRETLAVDTASNHPYGLIPTAVALSADETTLYTACGGGNEIAVIPLKDKGKTSFLQTAWFPISVATVPAKAAGGGESLVVACSKGFGAQVKREKSGASGAYGVSSTVGVVQFIANVKPPEILAEKSHVLPEPAKSNTPLPVPTRPGNPSVFKHVVYILKENHTYDNDLGDMPEGNGDKSLCVFPEAVTPNEHALAREFVLLDNFYTSGTNSADGHQWTDSAIANGYMEQNYAAHSRSYPYDGGDPLAYSPKGFLWNSAIARGRSLRVYGEFVNKPRIVNKVTGKRGGTWSQLWADYKKGMPDYDISPGTDNAALRPYLHPHYIGFPQTVPDQWRADQFIADVDQFEKEGKMPDLSILLLPNDHTSGTRPGSPTPRACVADNDLALGRIVERLSRSKFWPETLILVVEDDSQLGLDHVDGHRTVAFCISPYTRRGAVVHDLYNHTSMLATIERVLDLKPMTRFDTMAHPMTECFTSTPDLRPYTTRPNTIPLDQMNPPASALKGEARRWAIASAKQDWSNIDRADPNVVARAVWFAEKPGKPFPSKRFTAFKDD